MKTLYLGTYTGGASKGLYRLTFDASTGAIGEPTLAVAAKNPSFLAISRDGRFVYAVAEEDGDAVVSFAVQPDGSLRELNHQSSGGSGPCFVGLTRDGRAALVANYGGGTVAMLPINDDGTLRPPSAVDRHAGKSVDPKRQDKPYAHSIFADPSGKYALACDLGTDEVIVYAIDTTAGTMTRASVAKVPPGSGPRHLAFSPDGAHAYVVDELSNTVSRFDWNASTGTLEQRQTISTLPADSRDFNTTAEIMVHPSGRFVYASNRGEDTIAVFRVDAATGELSAAGRTSTGGQKPRNFVIDASGKWLVASNQGSGSLTSFSIDASTGALTATGSKVNVADSCCLRFTP